MWPWWIIYFLVPVFVGIAVTEYKSDIFRLLKAAFVHGTGVYGSGRLHVRDVRTPDASACGRRSARILEIRGLTRTARPRKFADAD